MSEPVAALEGAVFAEGLARIEALGPQGMITLRGDLGSAAVKKAATGVTGVDMPGTREARFDDVQGICWMSPDELLVLCPYDAVAENIAKMQAALGKAHALVADVSDARACFTVSGPKAREVLAKLAPVDLAPGRFEPPMFRRTRLAQAPAAFWMRDADTFQIVAFRSHATYVFELLKTAAQPGSAVDLF